MAGFAYYKYSHHAHTLLRLSLLTQKIIQIFCLVLNAQAFNTSRSFNSNPVLIEQRGIYDPSFYFYNFLSVPQASSVLITERPKVDLWQNACLSIEGLTKNMGWQDSNLRMTESKSVGLPLADTPRIYFLTITILFKLYRPGWSNRRTYKTFSRASLSLLKVSSKVCTFSPFTLKTISPTFKPARCA